MDPRLQQAIEHDDVDELHRLIVEEPKVLDWACKGPFPNNPLHVATAAGKTEVAIEIAIMMPSFARKLNPEGYSPMHLALQHEHYQTARALMKLNPNLIRLRGRHGITPLHYLTEKEGDDELELLAEFLTDCESSIEDLTSRCETAFHVAVRNHNLKAFKVLFGWLRRFRWPIFFEPKDQRVLDRKDQDGNTVLHVAAAEQQPEIIKLLIRYVNLNEKNFQDKTALEIFLANPGADQDVAKSLRSAGFRLRKIRPSLSLSQLYSTKLSPSEMFAAVYSIRRESVWFIFLLYFILCAGTSFQAALVPLRGYWQGSSLNPLANSTVVTANSSIVACAEPHPARSLIPTGAKLVLRMAAWVLSIPFFFISISVIWYISMALFPDKRAFWGVIALVVLACSIDYSQDPIEVAELGFSFKSFLEKPK